MKKIASLETWVRDSWLAGITLRDMDHAMVVNGRSHEDRTLAAATYNLLEARLGKCTISFDRR